MSRIEAPIIVAEAGCNHCGDMSIAEELIKMAAFFCKVDYIKFQKRLPRELLTSQSYNAPHPNVAHVYGETYGAHREYLELSLDEHRQLVEWCQQHGIRYACSTWDMTSAKEIISLVGQRHFGISRGCKPWTENNLLCCRYAR